MEKQKINLRGKQAEAFGDLPNGYFEQLPSQISQRLKADRRQTKRSLFSIPRAVAAAMLILLATAAAMLLLFPTADTAKQTASQFAQQADTFRPSAMFKEQPIVDDSEQNNIFDEITYEEILTYMIEKEEFEF